VQAVVDPLNHRTSYTYGRFSNVLTATDALNNVTSLNYDTQRGADADFYRRPRSEWCCR